MKYHVTKGSAFEDLGFSKEESKNLQIRAALMNAIKKEIVDSELTQAKAAKLLSVSQPRVSDLLKGKIHLFTIDSLVNILTKLGKPVSLRINNKKIAA